MLPKPFTLFPALAEKSRPPSAVADHGGVIEDYYKGIFDYTHEVLDNPSTGFPEWAGKGYQIVGFACHPGYNDRVNPPFSAENKHNLPDLINDVRSELGKPKLPFVIATTGMGGLDPVDPASYSGYTEVRKARPANLLTSDTRDFWEIAANPPLNQGFHWNQNARSHFRIGKTPGDDMVDLLTPRRERNGLH